MTEPLFVAETLAWCNEMRAAQDMEPLDRLPKGRRHEPTSCPCGRATRLSVGRRTVRTRDQEQFVCDVPPSVQRFVDAFDNGDLPQYDAELA